MSTIVLRVQALDLRRGVRSQECIPGNHRGTRTGGASTIVRAGGNTADHGF